MRMSDWSSDVCSSDLRPSLAMPIFVEQGPASGAVPEGEREALVERAAGPPAERLGDVGVAGGEIAGQRLHLRAAAGPPPRVRQSVGVGTWVSVRVAPGGCCVIQKTKKQERQ